MGDLSKRVGGESFHVGVQIWAAISYLDSTTDYREYISHQPSESHWRSGSDVVMLDCEKKKSQANRHDWIVPAVILFLAGVLLYLIHYL